MEPPNQSTQSDQGRQRQAILGSILLVALLLAAVPISYVGYHFFLRHVPNLFVKPLESPVAADLCSLLDLQDDPKCQADRNYPYEFFGDLRTRYGRGVAIERVNAEIGAYQLACSDWVNRGDNGDFEDCRYSFEGDRDFVLHITYQKTTDAPETAGSVWRTCSYDVNNQSLWDVYACQPALNTGFLLVMSNNTFLIGRGFTLLFLLMDVILLVLLVRLWR